MSVGAVLPLAATGALFNASKESRELHLNSSSIGILQQIEY